ncbi:glycoside hydrolase family 15 protein [Nakamurella sp. A5-74]|uniref:Trehalase n=1 Tax=Nakamurella sp. A5-74 TaxID=3158264 RepID=A0AAU8DRB5_9ACTN
MPENAASAAMTFPQISDYAFLSDCEVNCLIAPDGSVEWMCIPRPDSPSIFTAMLDRGAGSFGIGPVGVTVPNARRYIPGTLVLETTWQTPTGWLVVRDALVVAPWHDVDQRSGSHRRAPTDNDALHCLVRVVECTYGSVDVSADCEPVFGYGTIPPEWTYRDGGYHDLRATAQRPSGEMGPHPQEPTLRINSSLRFGVEGRSAIARTRMTAGEKHFVAFSFSEQETPRSIAEAEGRVEHTVEFWREWLTQGTFPDHPWRQYLETSALALKGLTYAPTGALIAAATTSLPETPGGQRNWDYRYSWIRDSTFALWGLYTLGFDREADDFFYFIHDVTRDSPDSLQIMYGIGGEKRLTEKILDHLEGYEGAQPVRIGNGAYGQAQHDVWGALLDSIYLHSRSRRRTPEELWPIIVAQVESAAANWQEPDAGMWEVRGELQHFVSSKVMCWVALDRGVRLATARGDSRIAEKWQGIADEIHADVLANGMDSRGVFVQRYGSDALDASVLLMPLVRFLPADDERIRNTVLAIADELTEDGMVLRYRTQQTDDGLDGEEGAFTICSFWLVSALVEIGEVELAERLCGRLLTHASPLGLYGEEIEPHTGRHLGNFPQAFTHLALINAVTHVIGAGREDGDGSHFSPANQRV